MPASGLNGGVGNVTLPTLRPCLPRYTPMPWPRAGAGDSEKKTNSRAAAVTTLVNRLFNLDSPVPVYLDEAARAGMLVSSLILARTLSVRVRTSAGV